MPTLGRMAAVDGNPVGLCSPCAVLGPGGAGRVGLVVARGCNFDVGAAVPSSGRVPRSLGRGAKVPTSICKTDGA